MYGMDRFEGDIANENVRFSFFILSPYSNVGLISSEENSSSELNFIADDSPNSAALPRGRPQGIGIPSERHQESTPTVA